MKMGTPITSVDSVAPYGGVLSGHSNWLVGVLLGSKVRCRKSRSLLE